MCNLTFHSQNRSLTGHWPLPTRCGYMYRQGHNEHNVNANAVDDRT